MAYLLDTCVLSEGSKAAFNPSVAAWFEATPDDQRFASVLSLAEIQYGIFRLPQGQRRTRLGIWYENELLSMVEGRTIGFDEAEAMEWALLRSIYPNTRYIDSQIAATAITRNLTLVTRNVKDFAFEGLSVFNPWDSEC
jgi:toxin FitB